MEYRGYSYFGDIVDRVLDDRGFTKSGFARECETRGLRYGKKGEQRLSYTQPKLSMWMRGDYGAPRELPGVLDELCHLSREEWLEVAVAFAYGQNVYAKDLAGAKAEAEHAKPKTGGERPRARRSAGGEVAPEVLARRLDEFEKMYERFLWGEKEASHSTFSTTISDNTRRTSA